MININVLICDDDPIVHESLNIYLKAEGYNVTRAYDGQKGLEEALKFNFDMIVLDLMMPKLGGIELCREIRKVKRTPIIMLTAKGEEIDRIIGLELGADDYIVKPFSPREVVARIKAVLRRTSERNDDALDDDIARFDGLYVDLSQYTVEVEGESIPFTPKEVEILHMLASNPGRVYTREQILEKVWGYEYFGDTRTVDTHIKRIRSKISASDKYGLHTIYGVGYKFEVKK